MNSSDETKRAIRALKVLGFQFPPDKKRTQETFEQLNYEHLLAIRRVYKEEFEFFIRSMDSITSRVVEAYCHVCDREEYSYDDIPESWGWCKTTDRWYLMCDKCQMRWTKKFGSPPKIIKDIPPEVEKEVYT